MSDLRKDPIVGRWVIVAENRAGRPHDFEPGPSEPVLSVSGPSDSGPRKRTGRLCPFCEGNEEHTPVEILALREPGTDESVPLLKGRRMIAGKTTVYVCENYACKAPVSDPAALERILTTPR